ncbi:MAG TPA: hypothetical protein VI279_13300 [Rhodocyclaceae bacterium]
MSRQELLAENTECFKSRMGAFFPGSHVIFRGHDLHRQLKDMDWIELFVFGITGRRFSAEQLRLMHALWVYTSYPDARIWNNRVTALSGSTRSTGNLGLAAALAISEAHIYGRGNEMQAISFYIDTCRKLASGAELADCVTQELATHARIAGYGRPLINADERIAPIMALAQELGLDRGPHLQLAFELERFLLDSGRNLRINYGAIVSAFGADLGFTPQEFYLFMFPSFLAGMTPCYIEGTERPEGSSFPLSCVNICYEGPPRRSWRDPT